jgi:signal transduction histidine kinase
MADDLTERVQAEEAHLALLDDVRTSQAALAGMAGALVQTGDQPAADEQRGIPESILRLACRALCARAAAVMLVEADGAGRPGASWGLAPEKEQQWRSGQPEAGLRALVTAGEHEQLLEEGLLLLQPGGDRRLPFHHGASTVLLAVLPAGTRQAGVLALDLGQAGRGLDEEHLMLARAVASLVALAMERDRLIRERSAAAAGELEARETGRRTDAFLALAAHELRTPLAAASGNVQIVLRRLEQEAARGTPLPEDLSVTLTRAMRGLNRMNLLIDDLLDAVRPRPEQLVTHRARCDLTVVVRDAVEELSGLGPGQVRMDVEQGPLYCEADAARICQVVHNYLTNALKYAPEGSPIEVGVRRLGKKARVWVRDEGPGIPAAAQALVWERFYRVEGIAHRPGTRPGLGLGLYISKTIVEQHGGAVGLESGEGGGCTFWFTIPLVK